MSQPKQKSDLAVFFCDDDVLLTKSDQKFIFSTELLLEEDLPLFTYPNCFRMPKVHTIEHEIWDISPLRPKLENHANFNLLPLRKVLETVTVEDFNLLSGYKHLLNWDKVGQFCGRCGAPNTWHLAELAKQCSVCNQILYPYNSVAVLVLIAKGAEILLARSPHFRPQFYSTIAGFVSPGETGEQAVIREVQEEVGISIKNIRYFGCQMWPFPNSFMIAYHAQYAGGEIRIDPLEIEDAQWFHRDNLPSLPLTSSISRRLIDDYLAR